MSLIAAGCPEGTNHGKGTGIQGLSKQPKIA
jgi:hypothetical protein